MGFKILQIFCRQFFLTQIFSFFIKACFQTKATASDCLKNQQLFLITVLFTQHMKNNQAPRSFQQRNCPEKFHAYLHNSTFKKTRYPEVFYREAVLKKE